MTRLPSGGFDKLHQRFVITTDDMPDPDKRYPRVSFLFVARGCELLITVLSCRMPSAHTCFFELVLPMYTSKVLAAAGALRSRWFHQLGGGLQAALHSRLMAAIGAEHLEGFGFV